jgi:hypothetical protein
MLAVIVSVAACPAKYLSEPDGHVSWTTSAYDVFGPSRAGNALTVAFIPEASPHPSRVKRIRHQYNTANEGCKKVFERCVIMIRGRSIQLYHGEYGNFDNMKHSLTSSGCCRFKKMELQQNPRRRRGFSLL